MAKQTGDIKIEGTIGDLTFYKWGGQYLVKRKSGFTSESIKRDPKCARIRENGKEFGRSSTASKLLCMSLKNLVKTASDNWMFRRLASVMYKVVRSDTTSISGERNVSNGRLELLQGFEFNSNQKLGMALHAPYQCEINRETGIVNIYIPPFIPADMITAPNKTTYFTITAGAAAVEFQARTFDVDTKKTAQLSFNSLPTEEIKIELVIPPASKRPLFVVLGIEFYQEVDGVQQMVEKGDYNSLALVAVSAN
jgi:hypothetical protein